MTVVIIIQSPNRVQLSGIPWTAACRVSLTLTIPCCLPKFMSIELVMLSNHPIRYCPLLLFYLQPFPASESFLMSQLFASGGQSIGVSAPASILSMNIQGWFLLGLTGLIALLSKGLSRVFSSTTVRKHPFFFFFLMK